MWELESARGVWVTVETAEGTTVIALEDCGRPAFEAALAEAQRTASEGRWEFELPAGILVFLDEHIDLARSVGLVFGFCARYAVPGCPASTPWVGPYASATEAIDECNRAFRA